MNIYFSRFVILLLLFAVCIKSGRAVLCWECNSKHDPRCAGPRFDSSILGVVDCSQVEKRNKNMNLDGQEAKFCRKIVQQIEGEERTIRGCGWLEDNRAKHQCYTRTGTKDIRVTFCQCEGNMCNSSSTLKHSLLSIIVVLLLIKHF